MLLLVFLLEASSPWIAVTIYGPAVVDIECSDEVVICTGLCAAPDAAPDYYRRPVTTAESVVSLTAAGEASSFLVAARSAPVLCLVRMAEALP